MGWFGSWFGSPSGKKLLEAAARGQLAEVERLLAAGAPVDWSDEKGLSPLIMACYAGKTGVVRALLAAKANPSRSNLDKEAPLVVSANTSAARDVVPMLLAAGADVHARTRDGRTALMSHAAAGSVDGVRALLVAGAKVNERNSQGANALHLAADQGHVEVGRLLLEAGANPEARLPPAGATALGIALQQGHDDFARLLLPKVDPNDGAVGDRPALFVAAQSGRAELVPALIARGAALDYTDPDVGSALAAAVVAGAEGTALSLLEVQVPVGLVNLAGAQALHLAAYMGSLPVVTRLVEAGADIHALTGPKGTPLRAAASRGHLEVVRFLLSRGADPAPVDHFGREPEEDAEEQGHHLVGDLLRGSPRPEVPPREPSRPSLLHNLPPRADACLSGVRGISGELPTAAKFGCSSVEAPTMVAAIKDVIPGAEITFEVDHPDPRLPLRPLSLTLWRYTDLEERRGNAAPGVAPPPADVSRVIARIAVTPYLLRLWSARAAAAASALGPARSMEVAATMALPPERPEHLTAWDWRFRVQVAAALVLAHLDPGGLLVELLDGPVDWSCTAAIIGLFDLARRDSAARAGVIDRLGGLLDRPANAPTYQHVQRPAAEALSEMAGLTPARRVMVEALLRQ